MRRICLAALLVLISRVAAADDWDRTYKPEGQGSFPCPQPHQDVVVSGGHYSIPWELHIGNEYVTIAHIEGTVGADGETDDATTRFERFSPKVLKALADDSDSPTELRKRVPRVKFSVRRHNSDRNVTVSYEQGSCSATWLWSHKATSTAADSGSVDCNAGPYAVALWSKTRAYKTGEFARVSTPGQPIRLYRCVDACKAGDDPKPAAGRDAAWALFGECAGAATPAAPLPATGSAKWDTTYKLKSGGSEDWRCPRDVQSITVSKGTFSIPWALAIGGGDDKSVQVGTLDGVIAADGTTTFQPTFHITSVPREVIREAGIELSGGAAMAQLRAWATTATMKFETSVRKTKFDAKGRSAHLEIGKPNDCELTVNGADFDYGEIPDEVECSGQHDWDPRRDYRRSDGAVMMIKGVRTRFSCDDSNGCPAGARPSEASSWRRVGHCG